MTHRFLILGAAALVGCRSPTGPEALAQLAAELDVRPNSIEAAISERAVITVTVRNTGARALTFDGACVGPAYRVFLDSALVESPQCAILFEAATINLRRGDSTRTTGWFSSVRYQAGGRWVARDAGSYRIEAGWYQDGAFHPLGVGATLQVLP